MNETLRGTWTRVVDRWKGISPNMRRNLVVVVVAAVAALSAIIWIVSRPHYVTIMSGLDDKSLGQVETQLQQLKIPDQIQGSSVLVPANQANQARVQLAMAGLPQSGYIGYSGVGTSIGMTQDQFNIQVLDALQQSMNATISSIDGIESAQVHIVMPQQQLFVTQPTTDAKASVFVTLGPGVQLSSAQVAGIQQLVAHSVQGLSVDNVSVVDQNGNTLSGTSSSDPAVGGASTELGMREKVENDMTQKLNAGLQQIVGPGNAVVVVRANVTFNQTTSNSHTLQNAPGSTNGFVTSQQTNKSQSNSTNGAGGPAGQAGTNPNNPTYTAGNGFGGNSTSSQTQTTTNYDYSYTNQQTTSDPMQIQGYSVGVILNSNDKSINAAEVNQIKSFVTNVVGQSPTQGANNVAVSSVPFNQAPTTGLQSSKSNYLLYGLGAFVLLLLIVGVLMWRRRRAKTESMDVVARVQDAYQNELQELPPTEDEVVRNQLVGLAEQRPDEFASLLRTWLSE
ncbi:flagellar basal-body MS-ring/collar protein FliF [Alicyclobacillus dauci]|uniref:Flagellar M-ring protein n=1 Tax=Alicyclobacillus dauci TaxID=1475485 RepID=A0ABY6YYA6_9BACL|nr:flagellar basal-body MS-ring/collar protein FliF [Alicyclobacillus dauci]WAH35407.1 flagellar basal-body MS-ring/collar protein FliF [Alicyclobacillus dauci]